MTWLHKLRARFQLLRSRRGTDARFDDELRFHLEMEAERLAREEGLDAAEAWRQAGSVLRGRQPAPRCVSNPRRRCARGRDELRLQGNPHAV
jgi:hypothetical protein